MGEAAFRAALAAYGCSAAPLMPPKLAGAVGAGRGLMTMSRRSPFLMGSVKTTGRRLTKMETLTRLVAGGGSNPTASRASLTVVAFFSEIL